MCATVEATVVTVDAAGATVEWEGRRRRAMTLLVPDVEPGDRVIVGLGMILRRPATDGTRQQSTRQVKRTPP